jgi:Abortive infection C-terminus
MSSLKAIEKSKFEYLFGMGGGYVLDFTDGSFGIFSAEFDIEIHDDKYRIGGSSKANKLRTFWTLEDDNLVGTVLSSLVDYFIESNPSATTNKAANIDQCRAICQRLLGASPGLAPLKKMATVFNAQHMAEQVRRMESSIHTDPALAIGTAKELIETCCKTILAERGKQVQGSPDIPVLTKEVLKELKLTPDGIPEQARGSDVIKRILRSLGSISNDLAELRGLYGTGHGKHGQVSGLTPRHARLAVSTAAAFCSFLFDTHKDASSRKSVTQIWFR